jgi:hypothetical protein
MSPADGACLHTVVPQPQLDEKKEVAVSIKDRMRTLLNGDGAHDAHTAPVDEVLRAGAPAPSIDRQVEMLAALGLTLREHVTAESVARAVRTASRRDLEVVPAADEQPETTPPVPGLQRCAFWWLLHERIDGRYAIGGRHRVLPPRADLFGESAPSAEQLARSIHKVAQRLCSDTGAPLPEIEVSDLRVRSQLLTTATVRLDGRPHIWSDVRDRDFVRTLARVCSTPEQSIMVFDDHGADTHWTRPMVDVLVVPAEHVDGVAAILREHVRPAVAAAHAWIDLPYSGRDEASRSGRRAAGRRRGQRMTPWAPPALLRRAA